MIDERYMQSGLMEVLDRPITGIELPPRVVLVRLGVTFALTFLLSQVYRFMNRQKADRHVMMHSMIYIGTVLSGAMMIIGTNLATAFGLLGAVSIIRFRTVVDNSVDMSFLFLAIVIGISAGLGLFVHAIVISIFVGTAMVVLHLAHERKRQPGSESFRLTFSVRRKAMKSKELQSLLTAVSAGAVLTSVKTKNKSIILDYEIPQIEIAKPEVVRNLELLSRLDDSVRIKISKAASHETGKAPGNLGVLMSMNEDMRQLPDDGD